MVSQNWLTEVEVDRPAWRHWLRLSIPANLTSDVAFLYLAGGTYTGTPPEEADPNMVAIANATGSVVAQLGAVPLQPLAFDGDGVGRWEDDLVGYNWARYVNGDGPKRIVLEAMTKSAVRAMDTVTAVMARPEWGERRIERFVVSGISKRGWTSWLAAAVDDRVVGIAPIVFDALNMEASIPTTSRRTATSRRQFPSSPCTASFRISEAEGRRAAAGDEFFLPDSSRAALHAGRHPPSRTSTPPSARWPARRRGRLATTGRVLPVVTDRLFHTHHGARRR